MLAEYFFLRFTIKGPARDHRYYECLRVEASRSRATPPSGWPVASLSRGFRRRSALSQPVASRLLYTPSSPTPSSPIDRHFFNVRRKVTPSNSPLPPPTARASAIARVMRGRGLSAGSRFDLRAEVFINHQWCYGCRKWSSGADELQGRDEFAGFPDGNARRIPGHGSRSAQRPKTERAMGSTLGMARRASRRNCWGSTPFCGSQPSSVSTISVRTGSSISKWNCRP